MIETLYEACERLDDGSAWADESEEFYEMCKLSGHSHPALDAESELADALGLNPIGTKCECGADLSFSLEQITGCGNCDPQ